MLTWTCSQPRQPVLVGGVVPVSSMRPIWVTVRRRSPSLFWEQSGVV